MWRRACAHAPARPESRRLIWTIGRPKDHTHTLYTCACNKQLKNGSIAALEKHRERATGDDLPYFLTALPTVGVLAVALGRRLEVWRIDDLSPLATVLDVGQVGAFDEAEKGEFKEQEDLSLVAAFRDDGAALAVGGHPDGRVRVYKLRVRNPGSEVTLEVQEPDSGPLVSTKATSKPYRQLAFHPNGWHVLGAGEDGAWRVWALTPFGLEEEAVVPAALVGGFAVGQEVEVEGLAVAEALDTKAAVQYSCRCGRFSPEGDALWTIHYVRRGPRGVGDRRPWLMRWRVSEGPDRRLRLGVGGKWPLASGKKEGGAVATAMALSDDGVLGVAGDSRGQLLVWDAANSPSSAPKALKPMAHSFAVTSLAVAPTEGVAAPAATDLHNDSSASPVLTAYLVASGSGDRTLRLQHVPSPLAAKGAAGAMAWWWSYLGGGLDLWSVLAAVLVVLLALFIELVVNSGCGWNPTRGAGEQGDGYLTCLWNSFFERLH